MDHPTRQTIYDFICASPGLYLRQIQRRTGIPLATLEYHLHRLERDQSVVTRQWKRFKAYFANDGMGRRDRDHIYFLRHERPRQITLLLAEHGSLSFRELADLVPITASTVSFHLRALVQAEILIETPEGRTKRYELAEPERVARLVAEYRNTWLDVVVDRFADAWLELGMEPRSAPTG